MGKNTMNYDLTGFQTYLISRNYKLYTPQGHPSTVYDYIKRINMVLEVENISVEELNENIDKICSEYDLGGVKSHLGDISHGSVRNALKRYREYLKGNIANK